ncbi:MAG: hypothetical protein ACK4PK_01030 [Alphaproteobacteria bacterium]|jgi:hypothetical protein
MAGGKTTVSESKAGFDFDRAVAEARAEFPKETEDTTFINGSDPDAVEQLYNWARKEGLRTIEWSHIAPYAERERPLSLAGHNGGTLLMMFPHKPTPTFANDPDKCNQLTFDHELGHIVCGKGMGNNLAADYTEHVADSFAVLRGLRRGTLEKSDIQAVAAQRDAGFLLYSGIDHLTSMSLDAIVINPKNIDYAALSPQQVIRLAEKHAAVFENKYKSYNALEDVAKIGKPTRNSEGLCVEDRAEQRLHALTSICMNNKPSSMAFYLAARVLTGAIRNGGMTYLDTEFKIDAQNPHWQNVLQTVTQRAGDRDIGAQKAQQSPDLTRPKEEGIIAAIKSRFTPMKI